MRSLSSLLVACILAFSLAACGLSPQERMDRARQAFADHRFSEARLDLGTLLQTDGSDPQARELLARTQLQLGDGIGARESLRRLQEAGQRPADYRELLAEAFLLDREFENALATVQGQHTAEGLRIAARAHIGLGDEDAALDAFERGTRAKGDRARLYADYALHVHMQGDSARATVLARHAREADPRGIDPLLASALIAQDTGDLTAALGYYEKAQAYWPESREAIVGRIGALGDLGRQEEARDLIAAAARRLPGDPEVAYLQARIAAEDEDWDAVRRLLQSREQGADPRPRLLHARALLELGLPEQALPRLTAMVRRMPDTGEPRRLLARAQVAVGNPAAAFETIGSLAIGPDGTPADLALYAEAARQSGRTGLIDADLVSAPPVEEVTRQMAEASQHMRDGRWLAAVAVLEDMRRWTGDTNVMVLNNLAYALGSAGKPREGLDQARLALQIAPDRADVLETAGWLMVRSGQDRARGIALLERAAGLAPGNAAIADRLAEARREVGA